MGEFSTAPGAPEQYCPTCERSFAEAGVCPHDGTPLIALAKTDYVIGRVLDGRYTVIERLGEGGMGAVYRATQEQLGREVAIKVVSPRLVAEPEAIKRFLREAKLASRLSHPNAVAVLDFGQSGDLFFLVMELLAGQTLDAVLKDVKALPIDRAVAIACQICDALDGAHGLGIIHRDLKPANIMIVSGAGGRDLVKVLDFGLAKTIGTDATAVTQSGAMLGTPAYMPPELALGKDCDGRADLYSLGCLLYVMLSGRLPFGTQTLHELIAKHAYEDPERLEGFPTGLTDVVMKLLAKDPADRFQSAAETLAALNDAWNENMVSGVMNSVGSGRLHTPRPSMQRLSMQTPMPMKAVAATRTAVVEAPRRRRAPVIAIALVLVVALGAAGVYLWQQQREEETSEAAMSPTDMAGAAAGSVGEALMGTPDAAPVTPVIAPPVTDDTAAQPAIATTDPETKPDKPNKRDRKKKRASKRPEKKPGKTSGKTPEKPEKPEKPVEKPAGPEVAPF